MSYDDYNYEDALRESRKRKRRALALKRKRQELLKKKIMFFLALVVIVVLVFSIVKVTTGVKKKNTAEVAADVNQIETESEEVTEVETTTAFEYAGIASDCVNLSGDSNIRSDYAALLDVESNSIIAQKNATTKIYPASMTKVMTLIVVSEHLDEIEETFTYSNELIYPLVKQEASRAGFDAGEVVDVEDMLYGLILPSGADAAEALAIMVAGSSEEFVVMMNDKCKELGLKNTQFANPTGLHDSNQYTTAMEMAMIMKYAMQDEYRAKILGTYQYTTKPTDKHPEGILLTSTMYSRAYGTEAPGVTVIGGKTGYVYEAGNCLVSYGLTATGKGYVFCTAKGHNAWDPIYDEIYAYKNLVPDTAKNLNTESLASEDGDVNN